MILPENWDWKHPDYTEIYKQRIEYLKRIRAEPGLIPALKQHFKAHPVDFINAFGNTFDPRNAEIGLPTDVPFLLFPKQAEFITWLDDLWRKRTDGLAEKSRDMGASWLCVAFAVWMWLYHSGSVVGFGSRKEEYVDKIGDPKSLFWKVRQFIASLPIEFRPAGYDEKKHAPFMRILNPENGSAIVGEAGDNIGRGNRTSIYFKDEAQPLSSKVLTPDGWVLMGDIQIGAQVIGVDGLAHVVIGINDAGVFPVYRIGFSDGTFVECSPNHLWTVDKVLGGRERVTLSASEIAEQYRYDSPGGQAQYRYRVPVCSPVEFRSCAELPLHPYVLGALLGDGSFADSQSSTTFTSANPEIVAQISELLPHGYSIVAAGQRGIEYRVVSATGRGKGLRGEAHVINRALRDLELRGLLSHQKFIPEAYLLASPEDRLAILQGLMDTDGSGSGGVASFHTSSRMLADGVMHLVQSLGGTATRNIKPDARGHLDMHVLHLAMPDGFVPFRLNRKIKALRKRKHPVGRTITSIEVVRDDVVRCISIDAKDGLYITDNFVVTHNSAFYEHPEAIDAALSATSNCKIDISTPNGNGNPFYRKRHGGRVPVFTFHWKDDPRKDEAWYRRQQQTLDAAILAQEVDIDYNASSVDSWLSGEAIAAAQMLGPKDVEATGQWIIGVDAAHQGNDESVIHKRKGRLSLPQVIRSQVDGVQLAALVEQECDDLVDNGEEVFAIVIELDGPGTSCYDQLRKGRYTKKVRGVHTGARCADGRNYNLRAKMWRAARDYVLDGPVSLPFDMELKSQLASVKYKYKDGLLLMQAKKDYKADFSKSPDRADAFVLTFAADDISTIGQRKASWRDRLNVQRHQGSAQVA